MKTITSQRHRKRILIVEDDPAIQLWLRHLLRPWFELDLAVTVVINVKGYSRPTTLIFPVPCCNNC